MNEKIFDNEIAHKFYTNLLNDSDEKFSLEMRNILARAVSASFVSTEELSDLFADFIVRSHSSSSKIAARSKSSISTKITFANSKTSASKIVKTSTSATQKSATSAISKSTTSAISKSATFAISKSTTSATQKSVTFATSTNELQKKEKTKRAKTTVNIDFDDETRVDKKLKKSSKSKNISEAFVESKIMKIKQTKREMMKRMHRMNTDVENRRLQTRKEKMLRIDR